MTDSEMLSRLRNTLTRERYLHTLGVADTAERLAGINGVDVYKARVAALLHDCAKGMSYEDMISAIREMGVSIDADEMSIASVVHAPAGVAVAMRDYGVCDPDILSAIRRHTLGGRNLSDLEALIYVSDFIEPNRRPFDGLQEMRDLAQRDLRAAALGIARLNAEYVLSRKFRLHPTTIEMINDMEGYHDGTTL